MHTIQTMTYMYKYRILPKISPLPSLTFKYLHRYVCLAYKPPSHKVDRLHIAIHCIACQACEHVRTYVCNPTLQSTTSTKMVLAFRKAYFEVILL